MQTWLESLLSPMAELMLGFSHTMTLHTDACHQLEGCMKFVTELLDLTFWLWHWEGQSLRSSRDERHEGRQGTLSCYLYARV